MNGTGNLATSILRLVEDVKMIQGEEVTIHCNSRLEVVGHAARDGEVREGDAGGGRGHRHAGAHHDPVEVPDEMEAIRST